VAATTPLADVLTADGALLGERDGWMQALRFSGVDAEWREAHESRVVADRSARGFVRVHGRDAAKLLQGIVTSDVDALGAGQAQPSLLLTPKARVVADLTILRMAEDAFVVVCEAAAHDAVSQTLRRYRLASKASIEDVRGQMAAVALLGAAANGQLATPAAANWSIDHDLWPLPSALGVELAGPADAVADAWVRLREDGASPIGTDALELLRIDAGIPRLGAELDESVFPAEAGVVERAVSFTKGCYLGQETVARMHYRGHPNRRLRRLVFDGAVVAGAAPLRDGAREVGRVTSAATLPDGRTVGLGYVRRDVPDDAQLETGSPEAPVGAHVVTGTVLEARP
jgi:folate-binding protein YgfZ